MSEPIARDSDIDLCALEPIHAPGAIQPHGYLVVLDETRTTIVSVSRNLADAIGRDPADLIGRPVADILVPADPDAAATVRLPEPGGIPIAVRIAQTEGSSVWECAVHAGQGHAIMELEPRLGSELIETLLYEALAGIEKIRQCTDFGSVCDTLAREIRRLTGFDRVMVYRFEPDWKGEVIAESKADGMYSYLGHWFPAGDIPAQARALYARNTVRLIPDAAYVPSPLVPDLDPVTGRPFDLGRGALRSVSPLHVEYLRNMGVAASSSLSIMIGDKLWGLTVCHHSTARLLPKPILQVCQVLNEVAALQLDDRSDSATAERPRSLRNFDRALGSVAGRNPRAGLNAVATILMQAVECQGMALHEGDRIWTAGDVPPDDRLRELVAFLSGLDAEDIATTRLGDLFPPSRAYAEIASGIAARRLPGGWIVWFRREWPHTLTWGGEIVKKTQAGGDPQRINPRKSFAAWLQSVRGESRPWTDSDLAVAKEAHGVIQAIVMADRTSRLIESEAALDTTIRQLKSIADHLPALILYRDKAGRVDFMNKSAEEWLCAPAAAVQGGTLAEAGLPDAWLRPVADKTRREEVTVTFPDGNTRMIDVAQVADRDDFGELHGEAVLAVDVTEQKVLQARLREASRMEAVATLAGGVAHDLNNQLGVVIGNLGLLKRLVKTDVMGGELLDDALAGARLSAELVQRLLAFARLQVLQPQSVDLSALLNKVAPALRRALGGASALNLSLDPALWPARIDPSHLETCLQGLVANAREAMPGGGRLTLATSNALLGAEDPTRPADVAPGAYVLLRVCDTGAGIPKEMIGRIFEPFFTTKGIGKGTGLSMVFGFVKQSGGHMTVDSEPGRGTTFHLYFPCDKIGTAAAALPGADPNEVAGGSESVLLAEDDPLVRHVAERQLSDLGYMVTVSEDAAAALAILASERQFDLLFTDVVMPGGMDGVDLAEHAAKMRPELKVLLTSGFVAAGKDGKRNGPLPFPLLNKPYERHELARAVRDALDQGKAPDTSAATGGDAKPERPVG